MTYDIVEEDGSNRTVIFSNLSWLQASSLLESTAKNRYEKYGFKSGGLFPVRIVEDGSRRCLRIYYSSMAPNETIVEVR